MREGWEIKKLGEVVDIINGRNQSGVISPNGQYPIYGSAGNLMGYATDYLCEGGTTIIGRKGNISNPIYIDERFWNVDTAFGLYPKYGYDPKFLNYLCQTIDFKSRNRGTTIPSLVKSDLLTIDVPFVSSLPEQQRIVAILDECFAALEKAKANAEQNLKNAKELFESYLQGVFENKGEGWEEKKLGEVVDIINGRNQSQVISESGQYPIYGSAGNLMGYATDYLCEGGTTIIGRKGNISNPIYIGERFWNVDTAFGLFPKNGYNPKFINYLCQTIDFKSRNKGTTIPSLVKSDLLIIHVPFISSLSEQKIIVRQLDALLAETQKLEAVYQQKLADLEELKKSILQKAFAGELISLVN